MQSPEVDMKRIFVAGATGNMGREVVRELKERGMEPVSGVHSPDKGETFAEQGIEARAFDFQDMDSLELAMQGCDGLFLMSPFCQTLARFGNNAVKAARDSDVKHIVRASGYGVSSDAHWRLGRELGMVDQYVEDSEIPFTILRPNHFMQLFSGVYCASIRENGVIAVPEEQAKISYIDVRDIAACVGAVFADSEAHAERTYALTGPDPLSLGDVARQIAEASGRDVRYDSVPEDDYVRALKDSGQPEWNVTMLVSLTRVVKLGLAANVTHAVEHLTGRPARTFADFVRENAAVWK